MEVCTSVSMQRHTNLHTTLTLSLSLSVRKSVITQVGERVQLQKCSPILKACVSLHNVKTNLRMDVFLALSQSFQEVLVTKCGMEGWNDRLCSAINKVRGSVHHCLGAHGVQVSLLFGWLPFWGWYMSVHALGRLYVYTGSQSANACAGEWVGTECVQPAASD